MNIKNVENISTKDFRAWLNLNLDSVTWQGKYAEEFEDFWTIFFSSDRVSDILIKIDMSIDRSKVGPVITWFKWLKNRLIIYMFLFHDVSLLDLSLKTKQALSELSLELRNFFIQKFPHLDDYYSEKFQIANLASDNLLIKFSDIKKEINCYEEDLNSEDEIMSSLELTLFEDWNKLYQFLKLKSDENISDINAIKKDDLKLKNIKFIKELLLMLIIGSVLLATIKYSNLYYEKYLAEKIEISQPEYPWLDKSLVFKPRDETESVDIAIDQKGLEKIEEIEQEEIDETLFAEDFQPESEVILTSLDSLPKGLAGVDFEQSDFEEGKKTSYRDTRFGRRKAFRVMLKTADPFVAKQTLNKLLPLFKTEQIDRVKPGTIVPGGIYYNLYVPKEKLSAFFQEVSEIGDSVLYESRTKGHNPPGMDRVFIWIKDT